MDVINITPYEAELAAGALESIARKNRKIGFIDIAVSQDVAADKFSALAGKLRADKLDGLTFCIPSKGVQA